MPTVPHPYLLLQSPGMPRICPARDSCPACRGCCPSDELFPLLQALFVDNWRVLHGREAFTGYRQLCGCYLTRDDVLNTARLLGLQA